jgi:membrane-bound serine protease (ClpP class)
VQDIFESKVPVVVYVSPQGAQAGSAGAFITLAADFAVMSDGSNIGAARPVSGTGEDITGDMRDKTTNDAVSFMRSIAEKRNRNVEEAVLMVEISKSFTAYEALHAGIIDSIVNSDDSLLLMLEEALKPETPLVKVVVAPTLLERVFFTLSNPNVLMLLFTLGIMMIFLEIKAPGTFIFATIGILLILLFMIGSNFIPINMLALLLVFAGIALIISEIFVSSFGILAFLGVLSFVGGVRLLFDTAVSQGIAVSFWFLILVVLMLLAFVFFVGRLVVKDFKRKPVGGMNDIIGQQGTVVQWKGTHGKVHLNGEIWNAKSSEKFKENDIVEVVASEQMELKVIRALSDK